MYQRVDISELESKRSLFLAAARSVMEHCSKSAPEASPESRNLLVTFCDLMDNACIAVAKQGSVSTVAVPQVTANSINLADAPKEIVRLEYLTDETMRTLRNWNMFCTTYADVVADTPAKLAGTGAACGIRQCCMNIAEWHRLTHLTRAEQGLPEFPVPDETVLDIVKRIEKKLDELLAR